ncbi:hypothetical protein [Oceanobacillus luteolus]|uniref:Type IV secretion system protein n=1 Tax=Oceanobacillus luteolus TaxID=1274358 RepID=A0ABW4HY79_9BACI
MFNISDNLMNILNDIFSWLYESLIEPFLFLHSFQNLIFGEGRTEDLIHKTFTSTEITGVFQPGSTLIASIAGFFILAAIVVAGMRIGSTAINPASRTYYIEFFKDLAIVAIVFFNLDFLYDFIFTINNGIVNIFASGYEDAGLDLLTSVSGNGIIGSIIVGIIILFLTLWANWYYMMRKLTLLILMILGPLMIALFLIPQFKSVTVAWFEELVGTVFVQSIHAILFWIAALITVANADPTEGNMIDALVNIESLILYLIFIPTGEAIRSLLGMGGGMHNNLSRAGAMFGLSALAGVYGSVKGALDKDSGSVMGALKGARDGTSKVNRTTEQTDGESIIRDATMAANTGTDTGTTPKAEGMLKWGDIGSKAGKAIAGSAGSIGGAAIGGPMGSMVGASVGFIAGGVAGGVAGRGAKASKDLVANNLKNGKNSFTDTWGELKDPLKGNQEELANVLADKETADYENEFKPSFVEKAQQDFPDLDHKGIEMMWQDHKEGIHANNLANARDLVKKATGKEGKLASASSLANTGASEMTNRWANENKEAFEQEYDSANPLPENATAEEMKLHAENKNKAWNEKVASKQAHFQSIANQTADQLKDEAMGSEIISKDDFAKNYANNLQEHDKQGFIEEYQRQNPNASSEDAQSAYALAKRNNARSNFAKTYMQNNPNTDLEQAENLYDMTQGSSSKADYINKAMNSASKAHTNKMEKTFDTALPYIKSDDKEGFIKDYQANIDPSATTEQASALYDSAKETGTKQMFMKNQKFSPTNEMRTQAGNDYDLAKTYSTADNKDAFVQAYQAQHPNATKEQAEMLFDQANSTSTGGQRSYLAAARGSIDSVKPETVFNKGMNKSVNRGYLTNQLAAAQTLQDKDNFIKQQIDNSVPESTAQQMWQSREQDQFQSNLAHFDNQLPQIVPMKNMISKSNTLQKGVAAASATSAFVGQATGITPIASAAKNAAIKGKLASQSFVQGYQEGTQDVLESPENTLPNDNLGNQMVTQTKAIRSGLAKGISNVGNTLEPAIETAKDKQNSFQNAVAYTGGLVGGIKLYQKAGQLASRVNPYNKVMNKSNESGVYEASEIRQMASRKDDETGQSYIPQGNVQLVSTPSQSFVQVTDSAGQKRIVSRYGAGDSALKQGQVVYQDLTVDDRGGLKPVTNPYMIDTGGAKVSTNRNMNINPNKLIATNRPEPINSRATQSVAPYNAKVETGTFTRQEAINSTENIRLIVTKNQSYMVGNEKDTGKEVRISPISPGDARLDANDVREVHYTVQNKRFNIERVMDNNGKNVNYNPRMETDEYLYSPRNPRVQRRQQFERERFKKIGGID